MTPSPEQHNFTPDKGNPFGWDEESRNREDISKAVESPEQQEWWENEFDYLTSNLVRQESLLDVERLKTFIRTLLTQREREAYERGVEHLKQRILDIYEEQKHWGPDHDAPLTILDDAVISLLSNSLDDK